MAEIKADIACSSKERPCYPPETSRLGGSELPPCYPPEGGRLGLSSERPCWTLDACCIVTCDNGEITCKNIGTYCTSIDNKTLSNEWQTHSSKYFAAARRDQTLTTSDGGLTTFMNQYIILRELYMILVNDIPTGEPLTRSQVNAFAAQTCFEDLAMTDALCRFMEAVSTKMSPIPIRHSTFKIYCSKCLKEMKSKIAWNPSLCPACDDKEAVKEIA